MKTYVLIKMFQWAISMKINVLMKCYYERQMFQWQVISDKWNVSMICVNKRQMYQWQMFQGEMFQWQMFQWNTKNTVPNAERMSESVHKKDHLATGGND